MNVCTNPNHDHYHAGETVPMVCADCGAPMHYDYGVEDYVHDAPTHRGCFLVQTRREGASDCTATYLVESRLTDGRLVDTIAIVHEDALEALLEDLETELREAPEGSIIGRIVVTPQ